MSSPACLRRRPRRAARGLALLAVTLSSGGAALAYLQTNLRDLGFGDIGLYVANGGVRGNLVLRLEKDASFRITDGSDLTALTDSMARWTALATSDVSITEGARFDFASPIDASTGLSADGINRLYFAETDSQNRLSSAIAVSFFSIGANGLITDCDIVMNERLYRFSTTTPSNPNQSLGSGTFDLGEIATHEMGHCLGLDHSAVAGRFSATTGLEVAGFTSGDFTYQATLYPYGSGTIQGRSLSQDDASAVGAIYPNATLSGTTGTIAGKVLDGGDFTPVKGAHVVAVSTAAPDVPVVGVLSDVMPGAVNGEYRIVGLPPGSYYVRLEPLAGGSNPFTESNTHMKNFDTGFPWEFYNGPGETGFDVATDRTAITVTAGQTVTGIDLLTNVGAPDPNEPNDTRAAATPIACEQTASASIVPKGDIDYYALSITSPTSILVDVSASRIGSSLDPIAGIFDAAGNRLAFADNSVGLDPQVGADLFTSGTYYVAVASFNDSGFTKTDARTVGNYGVTFHCTIPDVRPGTCPGRVLYAGASDTGRIVAVSDADADLRYDGESILTTSASSPQGTLTLRRDGGACLAHPSGAVGVFWDDDGDFVADRSTAFSPALPDLAATAGFRRSGAEYLYAGDLFGGGTVLEMVDRNGDALPERTTTFTALPDSVYSLALDEAGTLYVLDALADGGLGRILAFSDLDGDGVADLSGTFLAPAPTYSVLAARRPGEMYAVDTFNGEIDRIVDADGDGAADTLAPYATGLSLSAASALAFDADDVLYVVAAGNQVLALPDADVDGAADRQVPFSPLIGGLAGIAFGPGPPEEVSPPGSYRPVAVALSGPGLRLTWEDQGPTVPAYNLYQGTIGAPGSHAPLICAVTGTPDGAGGRYLDITPGDAGGHYYLITASDRCGEGTPGRGSDGRRRSLPNGSCGAAP